MRGFYIQLFWLISFALFSNSGFGQGIDSHLFLQLHEHRKAEFDPAFKAISQSSVALSVLPGISTMCVGLVRHDASNKRKALYMAESMVINAVLTYGLKYTTNRMRPYDKLGLTSHLLNEPSPSFPSGHTSNAFSSAMSLTVAFPKWYVAIPIFTWATAVGYSRIHTGVHYPSDVIIGAALGSASAYISSFLNKQLFRTYQPPQEY